MEAEVAGEKLDSQNIVGRTRWGGGGDADLRWPLLPRLCLCPEGGEASDKQVPTF